MKKRKFVNWLSRIYLKYVGHRMRTMGYPFKFRSGLKAKLYYTDNRKLPEGRWLLEKVMESRISEYPNEFPLYDGTSRPKPCPVIVTQIQGVKVYFVKWPYSDDQVDSHGKFYLNGHLIHDIKRTTFIPSGEVYGIVEHQIYSVPNLNFLFAAVNNNCSPSISRLLC